MDAAADAVEDAVAAVEDAKTMVDAAMVEMIDESRLLTTMIEIITAVTIVTENTTTVGDMAADVIPIIMIDGTTDTTIQETAIMVTIRQPIHATAKMITMMIVMTIVITKRIRVVPDDEMTITIPLDLDIPDGATTTDASPLILVRKISTQFHRFGHRVVTTITRR